MLNLIAGLALLCAGLISLGALLSGSRPTDFAIAVAFAWEAYLGLTWIMESRSR